jgi:hypothetical protein
MCVYHKIKGGVGAKVVLRGCADTCITREGGGFVVHCKQHYG